MLSQEELKKIDKSDMYSVLVTFSRQIREATEISEHVALPSMTPKHIVICAMGGSAISGTILETYLSNKISIPITVVRDYSLPAWVSSHDLVVCSSYSGNTEETISCFKDALIRKANVVCLTSGGELGTLAKKHGIACITIPGGLQPRASIAYLLMPLVILVKKLGLYDPTEDIREVLKDAEKLTRELSVSSVPNLAMQVAREIDVKLPFIYGSGLAASVARRFKTQLNENPQILAAYDALPESNHNDFNAWPSDNHAKNCVAILLRYDGEHDRNAMRFEIMKKLVLEKNAGKVIELHARGNNDLSKLLTLIHLTDMISYYLAILKGRDPTPVIYIEQLKQELKK